MKHPTQSRWGCIRGGGVAGNTGLSQHIGGDPKTLAFSSQLPRCLFLSSLLLLSLQLSEPLVHELMITIGSQRETHRFVAPYESGTAVRLLMIVSQS